jgi:anthranilate phosphoribosyltransferase
MQYNNKSLSEFGQYIQRLIHRKNLTQQESSELFSQILQDRQPEIHQGAFLAALAAKGETVDEITGAWHAIRSIDTQVVKTDNISPIVENSGTGMDTLKTFNISSAAAIVASAGGVKIARHASRALTSKCGAVDVLESLGIDMECSVDTVLRSINTVGIGLFNGMSQKVHPNGLFRILKHIRFGSTLNIAASLAGPCLPTHGLRGVYSEHIIPKMIDIMKSIGYKKGMVVHGFDHQNEKSMDELSVLGESIVSEFDRHATQTYRISPEDIGIKRYQYHEIASCESIQDETIRFLQTLAGQKHDACIDITCLNAGAIFYLIDDCETFQKGYEKAKDLIYSEKALEKLIHWLHIQREDSHDSMKIFSEISHRAGLSKNLFL